MNGIQEFAPGVWLANVDLGDYAVRGALLVGQKRAVVWDTLSHPRDMALFRPLMAGLKADVVYSHADWDHVWGTVGLPFEDMEIIGHESCLARFGTDVPDVLEDKRGKEPGQWDEVRLVPPTRTFADGLTLDLCGLTLELSHLPGHTRDSIVGFVPERSIVFMGDAVETPLPCLEPDSPLDAWIEALRRWETDPRVEFVIPSHGPMGGREIIGSTIAYLTALRNGRAPTVPEGLAPFYAETHADNLRFCGITPA